MRKKICIVIIAVSLLIIVGHLFVKKVITKSNSDQWYVWDAKSFFNNKDAIALCRAIVEENDQQIVKILDSGIDVNTKGEGNMTFLMWALKYQNERAFCLLLERGADPNIQITKERIFGPLQKDVYYISPLGGEHDRAPLQQGDSVVNQTTFYYPANYLNVVLEHGGNPNLVNSANKLTPCYELIVRSGFLVTDDLISNLKLLIAKGVDVNYSIPERQSSILMDALAPEYILILLKAGADWRITGRFGTDILVKLANHLDNPKYSELRKWFEEHGFDIEAAKEANKLSELPPVEERSWLPKNQL